jgi:hypothetical protein
VLLLLLLLLLLLTAHCDDMPARVREGYMD